MSDLTDDCTPSCWARVTCHTCQRTKAPRGRSVPMEAATGYCTWNCPAYWNDPKPGHLWPNEARALESPPSGRGT